MSGVTNSNSDGRTTREESSARKIMMAVKKPKDENRGIGAKPRMTKPKILDTADAISATPVPSAA